MKHNNNEENQNNNYNLFNFNIYQKDKSFELKEIHSNKVYIISKEDYDKGLDYINNSNLHEGKNNNKSRQQLINFYHELEVIKNIYRRGKEFSIVTEEFLKELNLDEKQYKNSFVNYFEFNDVHFLLFQNNDILQITQLENEKEENNLDELEIIKNLILLYANDNSFYDKLDSDINFIFIMGIIIG